MSDDETFQSRRLTELEALEEEYSNIRERLPGEYKSLGTINEAERAKCEESYKAAFRASLHTQEPLVALCLSGGGIRSATFNLGVLQALAKYKLLRHFDYLSSVSGGGYVASWLTAWIHREREGFKAVMAKLGSAKPEADQDVESEGGSSLGGTKKDPVRHLRE